MEQLEMVLTMIDCMLNTKVKRHIVGGALISASLLFGGLAITVITLNTYRNNEENKNQLCLEEH